ncbi:hypothetical protein HY58_16160 [Flavihumibacter sp. ZG627]|nr:hypothetical protein HY58_16160 [Flavihumibacter sp. ZG627]
MPKMKQILKFRLQFWKRAFYSKTILSNIPLTINALQKIFHLEEFQKLLKCYPPPSAIVKR